MQRQNTITITHTTMKPEVQQEMKSQINSINELIKERGISLKELARRAGMNYQQLTRMIRHETNPKFTSVLSVLIVLGKKYRIREK